MFVCNIVNQSAINSSELALKALNHKIELEVLTKFRKQQEEGYDFKYLYSKYSTNVLVRKKIQRAKIQITHFLTTQVDNADASLFKR